MIILAGEWRDLSRVGGYKGWLNQLVLCHLFKYLHQQFSVANVI